MLNEYVLVDIVSGREIFRVASDIMVIFRLIDPNPIHKHCCREDQTLKVQGTELGGHAQVDDHVLYATMSKS
jgi:hypothetical protein